VKVTFIKQIHGCFGAVSSEDIYLEREIELSFIPTKETTIIYDDYEDEIAQIVLDLGNGSIRIYLESDEEIYQSQLNKESHRPIQEIVNEYLKMGWKAR